MQAYLQNAQYIVLFLIVVCAGLLIFKKIVAIRKWVYEIGIFIKYAVSLHLDEEKMIQGECRSTADVITITEDLFKQACNLNDIAYDLVVKLFDAGCIESSQRIKFLNKIVSIQKDAYINSEHTAMKLVLAGEIPIEKACTDIDLNLEIISYYEQLERVMLLSRQFMLWINNTQLIEEGISQGAQCSTTA